MKRQDRELSDPIREALHGLPREQASAGFTARLVRRLETTPTPRRFARRRWRVAAAAALLLGMTAGAVIHERLESRRATHRRLALELRQEELRRELAKLRRQVTEPPTLYLGSTSDYDVVLDLGPWLQESSVRPAAYSPPHH